MSGLKKTAQSQTEMIYTNTIMNEKTNMPTAVILSI